MCRGVAMNIPNNYRVCGMTRNKNDMQNKQPSADTSPIQKSGAVAFKGIEELILWLALEEEKRKASVQVTPPKPEKDSYKPRRQKVSEMNLEQLDRHL